jgi:hypothetical protein
VVQDKRENSAVVRELSVCVVDPGHDHQQPEGAEQPASAPPTGFDRSWARYWSDRYVAEEMADGVEQRLLDAVGPRVRSRGFLLKAELEAIGKWRSNRAQGYLRDSTPKMIEAVSGLAFSDVIHPMLRERVLCIIEGVAEQIASAVLTVWNPACYTLLHTRSVEALEMLDRLGELGVVRVAPRRFGGLPRYEDYLGAFGMTADRFDVDLRTLDRALSKWHREGMLIG